MSEKDRFETIPVLNMVEDLWDVGASVFNEKSVKDAVKENLPDLIAGGIDTVTMNPLGDQDSGKSVGGSVGRIVGATITGGLDGAKQQTAAEAVGFVPGALEGIGQVAAAYTGVAELADVGKMASGFADSMLPDMPGYQAQKAGGTVVGTASANLSQIPPSSATPVNLRDYSQAEREVARANADYLIERTTAYETIRNSLGLGSQRQVDGLLDAIHFLLEDRFNRDL